MRRAIVPALLLTALWLAEPPLHGWGVRAHTWINRVAVRTLPADGPVFLKAHEDWIAYLSVIPDAWRRPSEPFLKMLEDPNHGWFKEQFSFMTEIPRSRYEFVLKLHDEHRRLQAAGDPAATLTNVRWTGTMAYAAVEGYERMVTGMRSYRDLQKRQQETRFAELEVAYAMGWTGHYTADGAQPLHDTVHHDGWQGANPQGFTTNPRVHGLFETQFVELMQLDGRDIEPRVGAARVLADPFTAIIEHLDEAGRHTEQVYRLEKAGALTDAGHTDARALVVQQTARGAALLRDLAYTAWVRSGEPPANDPGGNPIVPAHPRYNPATGSAPAHVAPAPRTTTPPGPPAPAASDGAAWAPLTFADPVIGKNFYLFDALSRTPEVRTLVERSPALAALRETRLAALARSVTACGTTAACIADTFRWSDADVRTAEQALSALAAEGPVQRFVSRDLRSSGLYLAFEASPDATLLALAWRDAAAGLNRIVDVYALGAAPRYPAIDAGSYDPASASYRRLLGIITAVLHDQRDQLSTFYAPSLGFARRLLDANRRDEAGRFEPLHDGENGAAARRARSLRWTDYPYAAIVVPGAGPDRPDVALDPWAKARLELAVQRWRAGRAPFLIVSGGFVHPNQTPFNEALEMKRSLMRDFGVPADAIFVEPHARHTTTNLRNAARLAFRHGFPASLPLLVTSDQGQSAYISSQEFHDRCLREMGHLPGTLGRRLSPFDQEFRPVARALHADATDPLDP